MKNTIQKIIAATLMGLLFGWLVGELHWVFLTNFQTTDKDCVFAGVFVGVPLGSVLGLWFIEKYLLKEVRLRISNIALGWILSFVSSILCIFAIDILKNIYIVIFAILPISVSIMFLLSEKILPRQKVTNKDFVKT